jgi:hypothetical protein
MEVNNADDLYDALKTHKSALEIIRDGAAAPYQEVLDSRIAAVQRLLEWLSQALEPQPPASPATQTPQSSDSQADQRQTLPSAPGPPQNS